MKKTTTKRPAKTAAARATTKSKKTNTKGKKLTISTIRLLNVVVGVLLAGQAAALAIVADKSKSVLNINANFLSRDPVASAASGHNVLVPGFDQLASVSLVYFVVAFLALGAVSSLLAASILRNRYENGLKSGYNGLKWLGYIFSAGALTITAALMVGISDIVSLAMIEMFVIMACLLAMVAEKPTPAAGIWVARLAMLAGIVPLAAIAKYIFFAHIYSGGLPHEILITSGVFGLGVLIAFLALINSYRSNNGAAKYLATERTFILFSFLIPSAFAWAIYSLLLV